MDTADETARIRAVLRDQGDAERAEYERRYLKSDLVHYGVPVRVVRETCRSSARTRDEVLALADSLWDVTEDGRPVHETRMAAIEVLVRGTRLLEPADLAAAERLIRDSASWVYVDGLAEKVAGRLVLRFPPLAATLDAWSADPYMWIRRSALLALLPGVRTGSPDLERVSRYGDALIEERDFFIRKALGWVLRELSKKDPAWVGSWLAPRTSRVSGVTFREAVRHLPAETAEPLATAYRSRGAGRGRR
ncbi:DNA alkylation repair protein [Spirillospora sp. NPDC029432]|uniref:DNA alkylation repair protein n=1 Tax=Spirillospora sp. NPDC029432 TaxID=3154599 RepID=UPI00345722FE